MKWLKPLLIITCCFVFLGSSDCNSEQGTAYEIQTEQTKQMTAEAQRQVGMPNIVNFQQRKLMNMI